jgi:hypothetical protein
MGIAEGALEAGGEEWSRKVSRSITKQYYSCIYIL